MINQNGFFQKCIGLKKRRIKNMEYYEFYQIDIEELIKSLNFEDFEIEE